MATEAFNSAPQRVEWFLPEVGRCALAPQPLLVLQSDRSKGHQLWFST